MRYIPSIYYCNIQLTRVKEWSPVFRIIQVFLSGKQVKNQSSQEFSNKQVIRYHDKPNFSTFQMSEQQSLHIKTYLIYGLYILRTSPLVLVLLISIGLLNSIATLFPETAISGFITGFGIIETIFLTPLLYGYFYERIEEKNNSLVDIFKIYVPGYLLVCFCMSVPIVIGTAATTEAAGFSMNIAHVLLAILFFSLLFIYVIPAYYISGKIIPSITYGVQFFVKHIFASAPLLLLGLLSKLLLLLVNYQLSWLKGSYLFLFTAIDFFVYLFVSSIDFLLFIILIYILRNQDDIVKREAARENTIFRG